MNNLFSVFHERDCGKYEKYNKIYRNDARTRRKFERIRAQHADYKAHNRYDRRAYRNRLKAAAEPH